MSDKSVESRITVEDLRNLKEGEVIEYVGSEGYLHRLIVSEDAYNAERGVLRGQLEPEILGVNGVPVNEILEGARRYTKWHQESD